MLGTGRPAADGKEMREYQTAAQVRAAGMQELFMVLPAQSGRGTRGGAVVQRGTPQQ